MTETPMQRLVGQLKTNHLRLILSLEEHGKISTAAQELSITQPAASRMLADMERLLDTRLCEREPKGMQLTPIGQAVAKRARNLMIEMRNLGQELEELKTGRGGRVHIGAVTGAAVHYVVPAVQTLKLSHPQVDVSIDVSPSEQLARDLLLGKLDFILARLPRAIDLTQFSTHVGSNEVIDIVVHQSHPLASSKQVQLSQLTHYPWVAQNQGSPIRDALDAAFQNAGITAPEKITNTTSLLVTVAMLANSHTVAPMAQEVAELLCGSLINSNLHRLTIAETLHIKPYHLIHVKDRQLPPSAARLHQLVLNELGHTENEQTDA